MIQKMNSDIMILRLHIIINIAFLYVPCYEVNAFLHQTYNKCRTLLPEETPLAV